jgi:hypothetical protein
MNRNAMQAEQVDPRLWLQVCCKCYEATIVPFLSKYDIDNSCAAQTLVASPPVCACFRPTLVNTPVRVMICLVVSQTLASASHDFQHHVSLLIADDPLNLMANWCLLEHAAVASRACPGVCLHQLSSANRDAVSNTSFDERFFLGRGTTPSVNYKCNTTLTVSSRFP